jgi:hypothetical protein
MKYLYDKSVTKEKLLTMITKTIHDCTIHRRQSATRAPTEVKKGQHDQSVHRTRPNSKSHRSESQMGAGRDNTSHNYHENDNMISSVNYHYIKLLQLKGQILFDEDKFYEAKYTFLLALECDPFNISTISSLGVIDSIISSAVVAPASQMKYQSICDEIMNRLPLFLKGSFGYTKQRTFHYDDVFQYLLSLQSLSSWTLMQKIPLESQLYQRNLNRNETNLYHNPLFSYDSNNLLSMNDIPKSIPNSIPVLSNEILYCYGVIYLKSNDINKLFYAKKLFTQIIQQQSQQQSQQSTVYSLCLYYLGYIEEILGDITTAAKYYDEALSNPHLTYLTYLQLFQIIFVHYQKLLKYVNVKRSLDIFHTQTKIVSKLLNINEISFDEFLMNLFYEFTTKNYEGRESPKNNRSTFTQDIRNTSYSNKKDHNRFHGKYSNKISESELNENDHLSSQYPIGLKGIIRKRKLKRKEKNYLSSTIFINVMDHIDPILTDLRLSIQDYHLKLLKYQNDMMKSYSSRVKDYDSSVRAPREREQHITKNSSPKPKHPIVHVADYNPADENEDDNNKWSVNVHIKVNSYSFPGRKVRVLLRMDENGIKSKGEGAMSENGNDEDINRNEPYDPYDIGDDDSDNPQRDEDNINQDNEVEDNNSFRNPSLGETIPLDHHHDLITDEVNHHDNNNHSHQNDVDKYYEKRFLLHENNFQRAQEKFLMYYDQHFAAYSNRHHVYYDIRIPNAFMMMTNNDMPLNVDSNDYPWNRYPFDSNHDNRLSMKKLSLNEMYYMKCLECDDWTWLLKSSSQFERPRQQPVEE